MSETEISPLAEPELNSLDELFSRDPFQYSDQDIAKIVNELRRARKNWAQAEAQGKTKAPKKAPKPELSMEDFL